MTSPQHGRAPLASPNETLLRHHRTVVHWPSLPLPAKIVHAILWTDAGGRPGTITTTSTHLADQAGIADRRAREHMRTLELAGLVQVLDREPSGRIRVYVVDPAEASLGRVIAPPDQRALFDDPPDPPADEGPAESVRFPPRDQTGAAFFAPKTPRPPKEPGGEAPRVHAPSLHSKEGTGAALSPRTQETTSTTTAKKADWEAAKIVAKQLKASIWPGRDSPLPEEDRLDLWKVATTTVKDSRITPDLLTQAAAKAKRAQKRANALKCAIGDALGDRAAFLATLDRTIIPARLWKRPGPPLKDSSAVTPNP